MELEVHIEHDARFRGTAIYLYGKNKDGDFVIEPIELVMKPYHIGDSLDRPTFVFSGKDGELFLQALAQALTRIGFKPDELKASNEQINALKYHLEDMRKLVFKHEGM